MIIDISEYAALLKAMDQMHKEGYRYVCFDVSQVSDTRSLTYHRTAFEAAEYCYDMSTDLDYYTRLPINSAIEDLQALVDSGVDTSQHEAYDITGSAQRNAARSAITNLKTTIMNEKNFDYLKDQVKYTGFGEGLENDLKEKMLGQAPEFTLNYQAQYGKNTALATLTFRKSDQSDMYFFNAYTVELQKENPKENFSQTFYINKGSNITMKEAYNLMEGRSVNKDLTSKEGTVYNSWVLIDFKDTDQNGNYRLNHYHQNYGYDLEAALGKHPIKELETPKFRDDLLESLKRGNLQSVTFVKDGDEVKYHIEANPQFKTINIYDGGMQRLNNRQAADEKQDQTQQQSSRQSRKQGQESSGDDDTAEGPAKKKRSQSKSM